LFISSYQNKLFHNKQNNVENKDKISESNSQFKSSDKKAKLSDIYKYLKPYLKEGNIKKMLLLTIVMTVVSKGMISMVNKK